MATILSRKTVTIVLVLALAWLSHAVWRVHAQRAAVAVQVSDVEAKVKSMENENRFLASSSDYFTSDAYRERQARIKLNYKLPDEQVAFVYRSASPSQSAPASVAKTRTVPNWRKWLDWVFGH